MAFDYEKGTFMAGIKINGGVGVPNNLELRELYLRLDTNDLYARYNSGIKKINSYYSDLTKSFVNNSTRTAMSEDDDDISIGNFLIHGNRGNTPMIWECDAGVGNNSYTNYNILKYINLNSIGKIVLKNGAACYGTELPKTNLEDGQLFFKLA